MKYLEISLWTFGVFFGSVMLYFFFPVGITILGLLSVGLIARELGSYYDEAYQKASRERELDQAHQRVKIVRIKRSTTRSTTRKSA
jgi:hypothetical protein